MVNYDKWDALDVSDDEEGGSRRATVTRLDAPSRVTFGGDVGKNVIEVAGPSGSARAADIVTPGAAMAAATRIRAAGLPERSPACTDYARFDAIAERVSDSDDDREYYEDEAWKAKEEAARAGRRRVATAEKPAEASPRERSEDATVLSKQDELRSESDARVALLRARSGAFTENGGEETTVPGAHPSFDADASSAGSAIRAMWSQTRDEVTLSVVVPPGTRAKDVAVRCTATNVEVAIATSESDRRESEKPPVSPRVAFSDEWTHPIEREPRDDDDDADDAAVTFGDWEVCDWEPSALGGRRVVRVAVRKRGAGSLIHWWRRATKSGAAVASSAMEGRPRPRDGSKTANEIWEEATEAFKKRVKERERVEIHEF